eukprot:jgi/Botrbrau1/14663/Bobra.0108s0024.1
MSSIAKSNDDKGFKVDAFFKDCPIDTAFVEKDVDEFLKHHTKDGVLTRPLVVVTSGGTVVPLEKRCVRFIDNFSGGTRGALSTEYFLEAGYGVIFLHRKHSVQPFMKGLPSGQILDAFAYFVDDGLDETASAIVEEAVSRAKVVYEGKTLLPVVFETLFQYLSYLRAIATRLNKFGAQVAFYMAAAVSDFYIPWSCMVEHKMQSSEVGSQLHLTLEKTPKMLGCLRHEWAPSCFIVSFKLETDDHILIHKAETAIQSYGVHCVVANILETRKEHVLVIKPPVIDTEKSKEVEPEIIDIRLDPKERFIEHQLVKVIADLHKAFITKS